MKKILIFFGYILACSPNISAQILDSLYEKFPVKACDKSSVDTWRYTEISPQIFGYSDIRASPCRDSYIIFLITPEKKQRQLAVPEYAIKSPFQILWIWYSNLDSTTAFGALEGIDKKKTFAVYSFTRNDWYSEKEVEKYLSSRKVSRIHDCDRDIVIKK